MRCYECDNGLACCHETSVLHGDGSTECLGEEPCELRHELHRWTVLCVEVGCSCGLEPAEADDGLLLAA
jgi:hypothetical protein